MPLDPTQHLTCRGPVFCRSDMETFIPAVFPVSVPSTFLVEEYPDIFLNQSADYAPCIPMSNAMVARGIETQWASAALTIPQAFEALALVKKLRFSWDFMVQPTGWFDTIPDAFKNGSLQIQCTGSMSINVAQINEKTLIERRGFSLGSSGLSISKGDMDIFSALKVVPDGDSYTTADATGDPWDQPIFTAWLGHIIHGGMESEGTAQVFTYFIVTFPNYMSGLGGTFPYPANAGLGCIDNGPSAPNPDIFHDVDAQLILDMSPWHNYTDALREARSYNHDPTISPTHDILSRPGSDIVPFFKLETTTDVVDAYYGYEGTYNTTTGAPL